MPPDPKKPIEDLLEASARARRAQFGAEPKMPNPMRARLHDEIARLNREDQPRERRSWPALFWPQISIATAVAAVLVTASVLWLGHRSNSGNESLQLAMRAPAGTRPDTALKSLDAANQTVAQSESAPAETFAEGAIASRTLADASATGSKPADLETRDENGATALQKFADVAIAPAAPATEQARSDDRARESSERANEVAQAPAAAANEPPANPGSVDAVAGALAAKNQETDARNLQQQFSQTVRGQALRSNAKLKRAVNVLETFQVEQDGRQIRVVDADGSTYTGKLEAVAQNAVRSLEKAEEKAAAPAARPAVARGKDYPSGENEFYFRAVGYNGSLKKEVVFEGNYIAPPATPQKAADFKKETQTPARIVGTAKVPGESPVEIDAIAVTR